MFSNIFSKTLYERRWGVLWWSLAMFAITVFVVWLFPTFRDSFGQALQNVPDSLKTILGNAQAYQQINGYLEIQVFMQMIFLTVIYGIILFCGLLAGDESSGTLQTLLAQPVSRAKVYFEKLAAGTVLLIIVNMAMVVGVIVGAAIIGEKISLFRVLQATFAQWLVSMVFALVGYMLGAVIGRRGAAGALAGVYAFLSYLVFTLANTARFLRWPNYLSPFRYFTNPPILDNGLQAHNLIVLFGACLILVVIGWMVFSKRDIYQR